jgi:hypothetical protein
MVYIESRGSLLMKPSWKSRPTAGHLILTTFVILASIALLFTALDSVAFAADDLEKLLGPIKVRIQQAKPKIDSWRYKALWYLVFSGGVFVLGLITAALQMWTKSWTKTTVAVVGLVISAITGVLERGFAGDRRTYLASALDAEDTIAEVETQMTVLESAPDLTTTKAILDAINKDIKPLETKLRNIERKLLAAAPPMLGPRVAYASTAPAFVVGAGECNYLWQARENSQAAAVEKMVTRLAADAALNLSAGSRDSLRDYVSQYGSATNAKPSESGMVRFETRLSLNSTFANAYAIKSYLDSQLVPSREKRIQSVRQRLKAGKLSTDIDGFLETTFQLPLKGGSVRLEAKIPKKGSFVFVFTAAPTKQGPAQVSLKSVDVLQDGSVGSASWSFDVLSGGNVIISLPMQRWDDSKRPTSCTLDPEAGFSGLANPSGEAIQLTLVGLTPKAIEAAE